MSSGGVLVALHCETTRCAADVTHRGVRHAPRWSTVHLQNEEVKAGQKEFSLGFDAEEFASTFWLGVFPNSQNKKLFGGGFIIPTKGSN